MTRVTFQQTCRCLEVGQLLCPKSPKISHDWFGYKYSLKVWCLVVNLQYRGPLDTLVTLPGRTKVKFIFITIKGSRGFQWWRTLIWLFVVCRERSEKKDRTLYKGKKNVRGETIVLTSRCLEERSAHPLIIYCINLKISYFCIVFEKFYLHWKSISLIVINNVQYKVVESMIFAK